jgi:hypothetical protein
MSAIGGESWPDEALVSLCWNDQGTGLTPWTGIRWTAPAPGTTRLAAAHVPSHDRATASHRPSGDQDREVSTEKLLSTRSEPPRADIRRIELFPEPTAR